MVRRPIAVVLACLYALGGVLAAPASAASPPAARPGDCPATAQAGVARRPGADTALPRRLTHAMEPREPGPDEAARMTADLDRRLRAAERSGAAGLSRRDPGTVERITVPVWVHIVRDGALGLPDTAVARQIAVLNTAYSGGYGGADTGVRFELKGVTHTDNRAWFRDPLGYEEPLKEKLRTGGPETLNLFIAQMSRLVLGYSTYPYWYKDDPGLDGVVVDWRSVPGGPLRDFARGFTAVHEIGHWLGLLHTFENGCAAPGDSVDDTPAEARPTTGCPPRKDSCPAPGNDPMHNFMDYSQDRCMREFTPGQAVRIRQMWDVYRRPGPRGADPEVTSGALAAPPDDESAGRR
ncbi:zinc metalloprotease [Microbispora triticiradicis]|uniref:zinc metalloprotease n=1 Tax=Microbispora triticiradicis TaxID=2200763 RepID=UPI001AD67044|nr:zinc metalloprotease [Microbispora triticiradicis]MBO4273475.1 zinc metalloprotease [Microbispora triticiradicis]